MRAGLWQAPMLLLLYQTAPLDVRREGGQVRIGFGYGQGNYDEVIAPRSGVTCDGTPWYEPGKRAPVTRRTIGGSVEVWLGKAWRVATALGKYRSATPADWPTVRDGMFASAILAVETRPVGFGAGLRVLPADPRSGRSSDHGPVIYVRAGNPEAVHFRIDAAQGAPGSLPGFRGGLGFGYGRRVQPRLFAGILAFPEGPARFGAELDFPIGRFAPVVFGSVGKGWDAGAGFRAILP